MGPTRSVGASASSELDNLMSALSIDSPDALSVPSRRRKSSLWNKPRSLVLAAAEGADASELKGLVNVTSHSIAEHDESSELNDLLSQLAAPSSTIEAATSHDLSDLFANLVADATDDMSAVEDSGASAKKRRKRRKKK